MNSLKRIQLKTNKYKINIMKQLLSVLCFAVLIGCTSKNSIKGTYKAMEKSSFIKGIEFDGEVANFRGGHFNLMPAYKYEVKNNTVYVGTELGTYVFEIIDENTLRGKTSIYDGIYKKQK